MKSRKDFIWEISYRHFKAFRISTFVRVLTFWQWCRWGLPFFRDMTLRCCVIGSRRFEETLCPYRQGWQILRKTAFQSLKIKSLRCLERSGSDYALTQCHISGEPNPFLSFNPLKPNGKYTLCIVYIRNCCHVKKLHPAHALAVYSCVS